MCPWQICSAWETNYPNCPVSLISILFILSIYFSGPSFSSLPPSLTLGTFVLPRLGGGERLLTGGNPRVAFFATAFRSCFVTLEEEVTGRILYDRSLSLLKDVRHEGYKCTAKIASSSSFTELLSHGCYDYKLPTSCGSLAIQVLWVLLTHWCW